MVRRVGLAICRGCGRTAGTLELTMSDARGAPYFFDRRANDAAQLSDNPALSCQTNIEKLPWISARTE